MELFLCRTYLKGGTNGKIYYQHGLICERIELPWRNNKRSISCIPEAAICLLNVTIQNTDYI
ncbi:DUF5675 family protein [Pedobacter sp. R20-19]|uniref:DUF5675 family protein n=1 Tax=Pedobacter sp. R20-19 TaxID=1270196 RepID=UPI003519CA78